MINVSIVVNGGEGGGGRGVRYMYVWLMEFMESMNVIWGWIDRLMTNYLLSVECCMIVQMKKCMSIDNISEYLSR